VREKTARLLDVGTGGGADEWVSASSWSQVQFQRRINFDWGHGIVTQAGQERGGSTAAIDVYQRVSNHRRNTG